MIFLVSDLHLGKEPHTDEQSLSELRACIKSLTPGLTDVVFLGDTFDAYIEYGGTPPKSVIRWVNFAQQLRAMGIELTFFAGNHDRWHQNYLQSSLKLKVRRVPEVKNWLGKKIWLEHGDLAAPHSPLIQLVRNITDSRIALNLYRTVLPFGLGQRVAAYVSRRFSSFEPDPETVQGLRDYAIKQCNLGKADIVVMGHCHLPELVRTGGTGYVNTGDWYRSRSFATLSDSISLNKWTSAGAEEIAQAIL